MHRLRIVTGPNLAAAVVADLADDVIAAQADGLSFGAPDLAFDELGRSVEGGRTVNIVLDVPIGGAYRARAAQRLQDIARSISLPGRWLMVQRTKHTAPAWFRIRPSAPGEVNLDAAHVGAPTAHLSWTLTLTVDSLSVGQRRYLPKVGTSDETSTITNSGPDRGIVVDAPGEAPTPLVVEVQPASDLPGRRIMIASYSVPWDSPLISGGVPSIVRSDEGFDPVSPGSRMSRSFLSGGTGIGATLESTAARTIMTGNAGEWRPEPGRYLVMLRMYREGGGGAATLRLGQSWFNRTSWQPWRTWRPADGGNRASWLPVGYLQHPYGDTGHGLLPSQLMPPVLSVALRGDGGGATVFVDQVAFVPVDLARGSGERAMMAKFDDGVGAGGNLMWHIDAAEERISVRDGFGYFHATPTPLRTGGWPVAAPGMATAVNVFLDTRDDPIGIDSTTITSKLRVSASPRVLHLGQDI